MKKFLFVILLSFVCFCCKGQSKYEQLIIDYSFNDFDKLENQIKNGNFNLIFKDFYIISKDTIIKDLTDIYEIDNTKFKISYTDDKDVELIANDNYDFVLYEHNNNCYLKFTLTNNHTICLEDIEDYKYQTTISILFMFFVYNKETKQIIFYDESDDSYCSNKKLAYNDNLIKFNF